MATRPNNKGERKKLEIAVVSFVFFCTVFIASQLFLEQAAIESPKFSREAILLAVFSALNFIIILALALVLLRNLVKLYFERKSKRLGSRFKSKLVFTFIALSFIPVILLSFLAYGLINKSVERWFSAPAYEILENAGEIAKDYYDSAVQKQLNFSRRIAKSLADEQLLAPSPRLREIVEDEKEWYRISKIEIYAQNSRRVYSTDHSAKPVQESGTKDILDNCYAGQEHSSVPRTSLGDMVRCGIPIFDPGTLRILGVVVTETRIPLSLTAKAYHVKSAFEKYQQLKSQRKIIRTHYVIVLILTTSIILFSFAWFAIYIARKITMPIQALAEGAEQVAKGDLNYRIDCQANDELEMLIHSFNQMTAELRENRRRIEEANLVLRNTNLELEEKRRYIETVLHSISTGVISVNKEETITMVNRAALQMLQLAERPVVGWSLGDVCTKPLYEEIKRLMRRRRLAASGKELGLDLDGKTIHVALTLTPITDLNRKRIGYVIVLDDLTELIRAEKAAAWQEVARRLAHEIKNPLTPIQLSAERIQKRFQNLKGSLFENESFSPTYAKQLEEYGLTLEECVKTVVEEGTLLKHLVNEFSQFARLPKINLVPCDLHELIENALGLYDGRLNDIQIIKSFDATIPQIIKLDPEQMKRVFVNLIDNAIEAMESIETEKMLRIETLLNTEENVVRIEIADSGHGITNVNPEDLFLPYFSTKKRGTGLGLAIVQQIVADHRGFVRAEDNKPRGAKIVIEIPIT